MEFNMGIGVAVDVVDEDVEDEDGESEVADFEYRDSLAPGSFKLYVAVQGRVYDKSTDNAVLHVQGRGPEGNRDYGVAENIHIPTDLAEWVEKQKSPLFSLTGSNAEYLPMQARIQKSTGSVKFQVRGSEFNRPYGASFCVSYEDSKALYAWLKCAAR
jgi:hypothetical protein